MTLNIFILRKCRCFLKFSILILFLLIYSLLSINTGQSFSHLRYKQMLEAVFLDNSFLVLVLRVFIKSFVFFVNNRPFMVVLFVSLVICNITEISTEKKRKNYAIHHNYCSHSLVMGGTVHSNVVCLFNQVCPIDKFWPIKLN